MIAVSGKDLEMLERAEEYGAPKALTKPITTKTPRANPVELPLILPSARRTLLALTSAYLSFVGS